MSEIERRPVLSTTTLVCTHLSVTKMSHYVMFKFIVSNDICS